MLMQTDVQQTLSAVRERLGIEADSRGRAIFSGLSTLTPGPGYLMGFNPGGKDDISETIGESLGTLLPTGNAWKDERWDRSEYSIAQRRVISAFKAMNVDLGSTFTTNAIFRRTSEAASVERPWDLWWDHYWPVHQIFLSVVRPKLVVCLGISETSEMLRTPKRKAGRKYERVWVEVDEEDAFQNVIWAPSITLELGEGQPHVCAVLGLPHPSPRVQNGWDGCQPSSETRAAIETARTFLQG